MTKYVKKFLPRSWFNISRSTPAQRAKRIAQRP
jgi:hypothetical protein